MSVWCKTASFAAIAVTTPALHAQRDALPAEALWYTHPAAVWNQALPIGNGHLGAMIFGGANTGS